MTKNINNKQLLRALSDVDDKYILEAALESKPRAKVTRLGSPMILGSVVAVVIALVGGLIFIKYSSNSYSKSEEAVAVHNSAMQDNRDEINSPSFSPETAACIADAEEEVIYDYRTEDASIDDAGADMEPPSYYINLPEELRNATISDYEYGSDFVRMSYFDESGELLLEIECCSHPIDDALFQNYSTNEVSDTLTLYFDGDAYVGAMFIRNDYYMIRTPMGVSEETIMELISHF